MRPVVFQLSPPNASTGGVSVSNLLISGVFRGWSRSWWEMFGVGLETLKIFLPKKGVETKMPNTINHIPKTVNTHFIRLICDLANGLNTKSCYPQRDARPMSPANQLEF